MRIKPSFWNCHRPACRETYCIMAFIHYVVTIMSLVAQLSKSITEKWARPNTERTEYYYSNQMDGLVIQCDIEQVKWRFQSRLVRQECFPLYLQQRKAAAPQHKQVKSQEIKNSDACALLSHHSSCCASRPHLRKTTTSSARNENSWHPTWSSARHKWKYGFRTDEPSGRDKLWKIDQT